MDSQHIFEQIKQSIIEVLLVQDPSTITPDSSLIGDLGADSIDFLDLVFQLEEKFTIKISKAEVNMFASMGLSEHESHINGVLTATALERLQTLLPEVSPAVFQPGLKLADVPRLITVRTFIRIVERKLEGQ